MNRSAAAKKGWVTRRKREKWRKENPSSVELMRAGLAKEWRAVQRQLAKGFGFIAEEGK